MKKAVVFLAEGFETTEALGVIDILKRGGVDAQPVSISNNEIVTSAQGVSIKCPQIISSLNVSDLDAVILPGGLPGAHNLRDCPKLLEILKKMHEENKIVAAICAAPLVLCVAGITASTKGTCYPGFEKDANFSDHCNSAVCRDENLITAQGPALTFHFGFAILEALEGHEKAKEIAEAFLMPKAAEFVQKQ